MMYSTLLTALVFFVPSILASDEPHKSWSGVHDFHGICDLVLLKNADFEDGLGMNIHVRTRQRKQFSYVSSAALQIGNEILEVMGDDKETVYWINKQPQENLVDGEVGSIGGHPITYEKVNSLQHQFTVEIHDDTTITMTTFKKIVRVEIEGATPESFGKSLGLMGSYGSGKKFSRDGVSIIDDVNTFGAEWQVLPSEEMIFHTVEGPQAPEKCHDPMATSLRHRRLAEVTEAEAKLACAGANPSDFDMCVFDVTATGDLDMADAY